MHKSEEQANDYQGNTNAKAQKIDFLRCRSRNTMLRSLWYKAFSTIVKARKIQSISRHTTQDCQHIC
jgi:hypothetical protein